MDAQNCNMNPHPTRLLSVLRAAMGLLECPVPDEGFGGSGSIPPRRVKTYYFLTWSECSAGLLDGHEEKTSIF